MSIQTKDIYGGVPGGLVAGLAGGTFLAWACFFLGLWSGDTAVGVRLPILCLFGKAGAHGLLAVLAGFGGHVFVSLVWGGVFGLLFYGHTKAVTLFMGPVWGAIVYWIMLGWVMPAFGQAALAKALPVGPALALHMCFGLSVALVFLRYQKTIPIPLRGSLLR